MTQTTMHDEKVSCSIWLSPGASHNIQGPNPGSVSAFLMARRNPSECIISDDIDGNHQFADPGLAHKLSAFSMMATQNFPA